MRALYEFCKEFFDGIDGMLRPAVECISSTCTGLAEECAKLLT